MCISAFVSDLLALSLVRRAVTCSSTESVCALTNVCVSFVEREYKLDGWYIGASECVVIWIGSLEPLT